MPQVISYAGVESRLVRRSGLALASLLLPFFAIPLLIAVDAEEKGS